MTASCNFYNQIGSKYTNSITEADTIQLTLLSWDPIQFTLLLKGWTTCHPLPEKAGKKQNTQRLTWKNMHVLWVKTHLAVEWKHMMFSFLLGSVFYTPDDLIYLNKTSPFPGSAVLCLKSVNIYKPYKDCDKSVCVPVSLFQLPSLFLAVKGLFIFPEISTISMEFEKIQQ